MSIQFRLFKLEPTAGSAEVLNRFLRQHRIVKVEKTLNLEPQPHYLVMVEYDASKSDLKVEKDLVDYEKAQTEHNQEQFAKLKEWRQQKARSEGIPAFHILKDKEIDAILGFEELSLSKLRSIPGFGGKRSEKYAVEILALLMGQNGQTV